MNGESSYSSLVKIQGDMRWVGGKSIMTGTRTNDSVMTATSKKEFGPFRFCWSDVRPYPSQSDFFSPFKLLIACSFSGALGSFKTI